MAHRRSAERRASFTISCRTRARTRRELVVSPVAGPGSSRADDACQVLPPIRGAPRRAPDRARPGAAGAPRSPRTRRSLGREPGGNGPAAERRSGAAARPRPRPTVDAAVEADTPATEQHRAAPQRGGIASLGTGVRPAGRRRRWLPATIVVAITAVGTTAVVVRLTVFRDRSQPSRSIRRRAAPRSDRRARRHRGARRPRRRSRSRRRRRHPRWPPARPW